MSNNPFPLDKAGLLLGRADLVRRLARHPLARALHQHIRDQLFACAKYGPGVTYAASPVAVMIKSAITSAPHA